jgi:hypothetical protein
MSEENKNIGISAEQIAAIAAASAQAVMADKAADQNAAVLKINQKVHQKQVQQQSYANKIKTEMEANKNCTTIVIDKLYHKYQPNFTASINGCTVTIPANGQPYKVHNDFAVIILRRMRRLSENIDRMNRGESGQIYEIPNN